MIDKQIDIENKLYVAESSSKTVAALYRITFDLADPNTSAREIIDAFDEFADRAIDIQAIVRDLFATVFITAHKAIPRHFFTEVNYKKNLCKTHFNEYSLHNRNNGESFHLMHSSYKVRRDTFPAVLYLTNQSDIGWYRRKFDPSEPNFSEVDWQDVDDILEGVAAVLERNTTDEPLVLDEESLNNLTT